MASKASKKGAKRKKPDEISQIVAKIHGVTPRYVRMVRSGEKNNPEILATIVEYLQGKNQLLERIKEMVPL